MEPLKENLKCVCVCVALCFRFPLGSLSKPVSFVLLIYSSLDVELLDFQSEGWNLRKQLLPLSGSSGWSKSP